MSNFFDEISKYMLRDESKKAFAVRLGVNRQALYAWQRGETPRPHTLKAIKENLGLDENQYRALKHAAYGLVSGLPSFREWMAPLFPQIRRPPGVSDVETAREYFFTVYEFWRELYNLSEHYQPGIPAEDFAALLGSSLEEIESIIEDTLEPQRAKEFLDRVEKLNSSKKSKGPPISTDRLSKLVATLDEATGELLKNSLSSKEIKKMVDAERAKKPPPKPERVKSEFAEIPKWNVKLAAGDGYVADIEEIEERYAFRREWLHKKTSSKDNLVMHDITGDSMEPVFSDGDVCLVDRGERNIKSGSYYALRLGDTVHIKKLQRVKGKIKIISLNKSYKSITINPKEDTNNFEVLGKVLWVGKEF